MQQLVDNLTHLHLHSCVLVSGGGGGGGEGGGGRVLSRNLGRGVQPTQRNPDPVQDTKDVNFATLSKRKCCNFLPCSRLDQAGCIQNTTNGTYVCIFTHSNEGTRNQRACNEGYTDVSILLHMWA